MLGNLSRFDIKTYERFLIFLKKRYRIIPFRRFSANCSSFLILRHDVEMSLKVALEMATLERALGISSTYFFHLSNCFYNLSNPDDLSLLRRISAMGHEIGIHYDIERYRSYNRPLRQTFLTEARTLGQLVGHKVRSCALHNRSLCRSDPMAGIPGYLNAYSFNREYNVFYVSDSCRAWHISDAHTLVAQKPPRVQLLIHPFHWIPEATDRYSQLDRLFEYFERRYRKYKHEWKDLWRSVPHVRQYDKEIRSRRALLNFSYD
jgi:hypothetical protein